MTEEKSRNIRNKIYSQYALLLSLYTQQVAEQVDSDVAGTKKSSTQKVRTTGISHARQCLRRRQRGCNHEPDSATSAEQVNSVQEQKSPQPRGRGATGISLARQGLRRRRRGCDHEPDSEPQTRSRSIQTLRGPKKEGGATRVTLPSLAPATGIEPVTTP